MTQADFHREHEDRQIGQRNEEIIRAEQRGAALRSRERAQNGHIVATTLSFLAASLWVVAVIALCDAVAVQLSVVESVLAWVPDSWLRPQGWGIVAEGRHRRGDRPAVVHRRGRPGFRAYSSGAIRGIDGATRRAPPTLCLN